MRILWHSNAPWAPTGYGNQTALTAPLLDTDHELALSSFYGLEGAPLRWQGIPVLPGLGGSFGNDYLLAHADAWFDGGLRDGLLLTLMDVWVLDPKVIAQLNAACWCPVDHEPAPPAVKAFFAESGAIPIAMSEFGRRELAEFDPLYVPHAVDTEVFRPHPRDETRAELGLDVPAGAFVIGMVAANKGRPSRKGFQQAAEAFRILSERHEDVYLYLHTVLNPAFAQGEHLAEMLSALQIPEDRLLFADQYRMMFDPAPAHRMAQIYSCLDVLVNPAHGEGFGIPVLEAQACGIPCVVTDFSAMSEVCGAGWKVKGRPYWTGQRSWQSVPDVGELAKALHECHELLGAPRADLSRRAREHALNYDARKVYEDHWRPALREIDERLGSSPLVRPKLEVVGA